MNKKIIRTSVDLTEFVQPIKERLAPIYGLKGILSAGILVFSKLSAEEREKAVIEANGQSIDKTPEKLQKLKNMLKMVQSAPFKILSPEESELLDKLRKELGPEPKQKRKAKGG